MLTALLALALAAPAAAAPSLQQIGAFASPTNAGAPRGDLHRVFVVEKRGTVQLLIDDVVQATPFLDVSGITNSSSQERGLLSIAFAADYAMSGRFYVYLTATRAASVSGTDGEIQVWEYRRSLANPDVADPASGRRLLTIPHSDADNHNGGQLQIGPDGLLYIGTGDGGGGGDMFHHSQDLNSKLGKLLRLDPAQASPTAQILVRGLRNPWRFSFDPGFGLVLADVGQGAWEEIDVGLDSDNFGWPCKEGLENYGSDAGCNGVETKQPVLVRQHTGGVCSITGGYVVHDPGLPTLAGRYLYGDYCAPAIRSVDLANPSTDTAVAGVTVAQTSSFGVDGCGRVLIVSLGNPVYRLVDGALRPCDPVGPDPEPTPTPTPIPDPSPAPTRSPTRTPTPSPLPTASPTATPTPVPTAPPARAADVRACRVAMRVTGQYSLARRRFLSVALRTDEPCGVTVSATTFTSASARLEPGTRTVLKIRRRRPGSRRIVVSVRAVDTAGNAATTTQTVRAR